MEINHEFITAVEPLVDYLRKNSNPHAKVILDQTGAELVHGVLSTGIAFDGTLPQSKESTFIERLLQEETELNERISKLENFINGEGFNTVDKEQRGLLFIQLKAMRTYAEILNIRAIQISDKAAVN